MRDCPETLNDGEFTYQLVRPVKDYPDGRQDQALYERVPKHPDLLYTPSLPWLTGQVEKPVLLATSRIPIP